MKRIRVGRFDSTTVDASETTRIVAGEVKVKRRLRVTRTIGSFFELLIPGLSVSGVVAVSDRDDMVVPAGQKLLGSDGPSAIPSQRRAALEGPKNNDRKRLPKK